MSSFGVPCKSGVCPTHLVASFVQDRSRFVGETASPPVTPGLALLMCFYLHHTSARLRRAACGDGSYFSSGHALYARLDPNALRPVCEAAGPCRDRDAHDVRLARAVEEVSR